MIPPKGHREPHIEVTVSLEGVVSIEACGCLAPELIADDLREAMAIVLGHDPIPVRRG